MSVEKMEMVNLIGYLEDLDKVSMEVVRQGSVHIVNALDEINQNNFTIMTSEQNTSALRSLNFVKPYNRMAEYVPISEKLNELMGIFEIKKHIRKKYIESDYDYEKISTGIENIYKEVMNHRQRMDQAHKELESIQEFQANLEHIKDANIDFDVLKNLGYFSFKLARLSKENYEKLKDNIENVSSIIYSISSSQGYQVVMSLTPKVLEEEVERVFKSLNYEELSIPYGLSGTPMSIIKELDEKLDEQKAVIRKLDDEMLKIRNKYASFIDECYSRMKLFEKTQSVNNEVACTKEFFYMAGWVPASQKKSLEKRLSVFKDRVILVFKKKSEISASLVPPTNLKNNWLVRPFESIVRMYGVPSYNEIDPTSFVAISYMIMFGSMFGDVGQGFIFLLAGIILAKKFYRPNLGGILSRVGISSMVFGVLFGSVFGNEEIIKPLLLRPMENINIVLLGGVAIGIIFTSVAFLYSLANAFKRRNLEDGVFGKDGLVGLLFYWIVLLASLDVYMEGDTVVPLPLVAVVLCVLLALMVLKQPVANLISGSRPLYNESMQDYYVESGFGMIETLLSMLSGTISFIRVGAFALNHVGLFVAFTTLAHMMKNSVGSIAVLVVGNIVIIGLEGLIVFIQGLRLEYYELFSKYYSGDGNEYSPVKLRCSRAADIEVPKNVDYERLQSANI